MMMMTTCGNYGTEDGLSSCGDGGQGEGGAVKKAPMTILSPLDVQANSCPSSSLGGQQEHDHPIIPSSEILFPPSYCPLVLRMLIPEQNPWAWTIINNSLAISGCILLVEVWYANKYGTPLEERPFAQAFYLIWEFVICFFWIIESGLSAYYQHYLHTTASVIGNDTDTTTTSPLKWYNWLELIIAIYFVITTFLMLWEWNLMQYDASLWEIALDTIFYVYIAIRNWKRNAADSANNHDNTDEQQQEEERIYQRMMGNDEADNLGGRQQQAALACGVLV